MKKKTKADVPADAGTSERYRFPLEQCTTACYGNLKASLVEVHLMWKKMKHEDVRHEFVCCLAACWIEYFGFPATIRTVLLNLRHHADVEKLDDPAKRLYYDLFLLKGDYKDYAA